jgi:hypothetical protein
MAQLQTMAGRPVTPPIRAVQGGAVPLKLIPGPGERLPLTVTTAAPAIAGIEALNNRTGPNFTTFTLRAGAPGQTMLNVTSSNGTVTPPIAIQVIGRIALPADSTNAGLLTRLFLAEAPGPDRPGATPATSTEAMTLMRVVLENRLARPSGRWASAGARSLTDVVRSPGQFEGFSTYPALSAKITRQIEDMVGIANDASDGRQVAMRAHIERAIAIASGPRPADPSQTGLFWWRTEGRGAPGTGVAVFKTVLGNTFFREDQ